MLFCLFLGWWGFPWGLVLTPVQIARNILGITSGPDPAVPSLALRKIVQVHLGAKLIEANRQKEAAGQLPPVIKS